MPNTGTAIFHTFMGPCGLAWNERGIAGVQLPESDAEATRARLCSRFPDYPERRPTSPVRSVASRIVRLLAGHPVTFDDVVLDDAAESGFRREVYGAARQIPRGAVVSYRDLAQRMGRPSAARAVGQALGRNPFPVIVPCHRVIDSAGRPGGFSASGGTSTKLLMLAREGVWVPETAQYEPLTAGVEQLRRADRRLGRLIDSVGPCTLALKSARSTFAALAEAIVYQQLHGRAAETIFNRVCSLVSATAETLDPVAILDLSDTELRGAGLSNAKSAAIRDLATRTVTGRVPDLDALRAMDDESVVATLSQVRGIGRWTAEMLLIFRLGRLDVLPVDDFGVRQGYAAAFRKPEQPSRPALAEHGERWRPFRSIASWYLWRAAELAKGRSA